MKWIGLLIGAHMASALPARVAVDVDLIIEDDRHDHGEGPIDDVTDESEPFAISEDVWLVHILCGGSVWLRFTLPS